MAAKKSQAPKDETPKATPSNPGEVSTGVRKAEKEDLGNGVTRETF
jgi:hypothetical protein